MRDVPSTYTASWPFTSPLSPHSILLESPAPDPELHMQLTKARQRGKIIPHPGGHGLPYAARMPLGWLMVTSCPRTPRAFPTKLLPILQPVLVHWVVPPEMKDLASVKHQEAPGAVQLPLNSSTTLSSLPSLVLPVTLLKVHPRL